jgi:hypothetical protein
MPHSPSGHRINRNYVGVPHQHLQQHEEQMPRLFSAAGYDFPPIRYLAHLQTCERPTESLQDISSADKITKVERFAVFSLSLHPDKTRPIEFGHHAAVDRKKRGNPVRSLRQGAIKYYSSAKLFL